jgi:hypothetical protein
MPVDFRKYTRRCAVEELAAIQKHLNAFVGTAEVNSTEVFCLECIGKHVSHLGALASEGIDFFPDDAKWWRGLKKWVDDLLDEGEEGQIKGEQVRRWMEDARRLRKELQAMYMGNFGRCECVTGLEPCCHGKAKKGKAA